MVDKEGEDLREVHQSEDKNYNQKWFARCGRDESWRVSERGLIKLAALDVRTFSR